MSILSPIAIYLSHRIFLSSFTLRVFRYVGYIYLGYLLCFFVFLLLLFCLKFFIPKLNLRRGVIVSMGLIVCVLAYGFINASHITVHTISLPINIRLKICFVSDIHIGEVNSIQRLKKIVDKINQAESDIVIIGGDSIDHAALTTYRQAFIDEFKRITAKYGVFHIIGNHECYASLEESVKLLNETGITILQDQSVNIMDEITLIGRKDQCCGDKKSLPELLGGSKPIIIVADHNPETIPESIDNGITLHLSGHTHDGQIFPLNILTRVMYGITGKLLKQKSTYYYTSSGAGVGGPPFRIGTRAEIVVIEPKKDLLHDLT
jgi:predicted MPP superfamily phosphohydrolase